MKKLSGILLTILLIAFLSGSGFAQADIGFKGVGGHLGFVMPEDPIDNTFGFGLQADLGTVTKDIHVGALIDYWSKSYKVGLSDAEWSWTEIVIGGFAKYYLDLKSPVAPYGGGGLGFVIGRSSGEYEYFNGSTGQIEKRSDSDTDTDFGFFFMVGADYDLSPQLTGFGELKYHMNGVDYLGIYFGVTYKLK